MRKRFVLTLRSISYSNQENRSPKSILAVCESSYFVRTRSSRAYSVKFSKVYWIWFGESEIYENVTYTNVSVDHPTNKMAVPLSQYDYVVTNLYVRQFVTTT